MRRNETERCGPTQVSQSLHRILVVIYIGINGCRKHIDNHRDVVALICVSDARSREPTVMISLQDTDVTDTTMVCPWGTIYTTAGTIRPVRQGRRCVNIHHRRNVAYNLKTTIL